MDEPATLGGDRRRPSSAAIAWSAGLVVVAAVLVIVLLAVTRGSGPAPKPAPPQPIAVREVTHVPSAVLDQVGVAGTTISQQPGENPLAVMKPAGAAGDGVPDAAGRPVVFYFGALWCPYCATERWAVIVALSRFGTFTNLGSAVSSSDDVFPDTQTWSFHGSTYASRYVVFEPVETEGEDHQPLDPLDSQELAVLHRWDPVESFPFLTIGGRFTAGLPAWLDPQLLQGLSQRQIADTLSQPHSQLGAAIDADANYLTAAICAVDGGAPASVCGSTGVQAAAALLPQLPAAQAISS